MRHRDISLTIALCASLCAHAAGMLLVIHHEELALYWQESIFKQPLHTPPSASAQREAEKKLPAPAPAPPPQPSPEFAMFQTPPPPPPPAKQREEQYNHSEFGDSQGKGTALNSFDGDQPMQARQAPEIQALLSRELAGKSPKSIKITDPKSTPARQAIAPAAPTAVGPTAAAPMLGVQPSAAALQTPTSPPPQTAPDLLALGPQSALDRPAEPTKASSPKTTAQTSTAPPGPAPTPTPPKSQNLAPGNGDVPAPLADSDSDPFSTIGAVEFHSGKVEARFGRKVKTTRPKLTLAGQYDVQALDGPSVLLKATFDSTGKVTDVNILHSSGSDQIDQPCRLAVFDWWFEPTKNKKGEPIGDVVIFGITFR